MFYVKRQRASKLSDKKLERKMISDSSSLNASGDFVRQDFGEIKNNN